MILDLFNNLFNNNKEKKEVQDFAKELSNYLEKENKKNINLKQENALYQVIEIDIDGAYLQNIQNNCVTKEFDIQKELLDKLENDSVIRYKDGQYIYEEELTRKIYE